MSRPAKLLELGSCGRIGNEIERRAVLEEAAPLRVEARQRDVILKRAAGFGEDALRSTSGSVMIVGPMSKRKPLLLEHGGFAADEGVGLEELHALPRAASVQAAPRPPSPPPMITMRLLMTVDSREHARVE